MKTETAHQGEGRVARPAFTADEAARYLRELGAGLATGGHLLIRYAGAEDVEIDADAAERLIESAQLLDGKSIEEAARDL